MAGVFPGDFEKQLAVSIQNYIQKKEGFAEGIVLPDKLQIQSLYPNPFNPETKIRFATEKFSDVTVTIYSILGEKVTVAHNGELSSGTYDITWYGTDSNGNKVPSGVYFYEVRSDDRIQKGKMLLLK